MLVWARLEVPQQLPPLIRQNHEELKQSIFLTFGNINIFVKHELFLHVIIIAFKQTTSLKKSLCLYTRLKKISLYLSQVFRPPYYCGANTSADTYFAS